MPDAVGTIWSDYHVWRGSQQHPRAVTDNGEQKICPVSLVAGL